MESSNYAALFTLGDIKASGEHLLWVSVVAQSMVDASSRDRTIRRGIVAWLASEDFEFVCDLASMKHAAVRAIIEDILSTRSKRKAFKKSMQMRFLLRDYLESLMGEAYLDRD